MVWVTMEVEVKEQPMMTAPLTTSSKSVTQRVRKRRKATIQLMMRRRMSSSSMIFTDLATRAIEA